MPEPRPTSLLRVRVPSGDEFDHPAVSNCYIENGHLLWLSTANGNNGGYAPGSWDEFAVLPEPEQLAEPGPPDCPSNSPAEVRCALSAGHVSPHTSRLGNQWTDQ